MKVRLHFALLGAGHLELHRCEDEVWGRLHNMKQSLMSWLFPSITWINIEKYFYLLKIDQKCFIKNEFSGCIISFSQNNRRHIFSFEVILLKS